MEKERDMEKENKDNVNVETTGAEEIMQGKVNAEKEEGVSQKASTVLGKFKDVDALYKAYGNLQAEFTRRSQRLKELEKLAENLGAGERKGGTTELTEKWRKTSESIKAEEKAFDGFVSEIEQAGAQAKTQPEEEPDSETGAVPVNGVACETAMPAENQTMTTENNAMPLTGGTSVAESRVTAELSSETLYEKVLGNEGVRLRIIGEYLASIGKGAVPLTKGGVGTLTAPTLKAKTLNEAGAMALMMFQRDGKQA